MEALIEHGICEIPTPGQARAGDRALVVEFHNGALIAAIDGLGHGPDAADAADVAARVLEAHPDVSPELLLERCHERLKGTRGAVMTLAAFDAQHATMCWVGVGNVEAVLVRATNIEQARDESLATPGGIVGSRVPKISPRVVPVRPGDTLVLATDGVKQGFRRDITAVLDAPNLAQRLCASWSKGNDDACVVVARYRGGAGAATSIDIEGDADVAHARIRAREQATALGFSAADAEAMAIAISELARNIVVHAQRGEIALVRVREAHRVGLVGFARDRGPGIRDVALALQDDYSTTGSLGCGLPGAKRLVDEMHVETEPGSGTVITIAKWRDVDGGRT